MWFRGKMKILINGVENHHSEELRHLRFFTEMPVNFKPATLARHQTNIGLYLLAFYILYKNSVPSVYHNISWK